VPPTVVIFAPSLLPTVTIEDRAGVPEIHVHAGGQGARTSRMISSLGVDMELCASLGGEAGGALGHLVPTDGVTLEAVAMLAERVESAEWKDGA
jgi:1-phosphofructokinase